MLSIGEIKEHKSFARNAYRNLHKHLYLDLEVRESLQSTIDYNLLMIDMSEDELKKEIDDTNRDIREELIFKAALVG